MSKRKYYEHDPVAEVRVERLQHLLQAYVSIDEAAKLLRLNPVTTRARVARGSISSVRTTTSVFVPKSEIIRLRHTYRPRDEEQTAS